MKVVSQLDQATCETTKTAGFFDGKGLAISMIPLHSENQSRRQAISRFGYTPTEADMVSKMSRTSGPTTGNKNGCHSITRVYKSTGVITSLEQGIMPHKTLGFTCFAEARESGALVYDKDGFGYSLVRGGMTEERRQDLVLTHKAQRNAGPGSGSQFEAFHEYLGNILQANRGHFFGRSAFNPSRETVWFVSRPPVERDGEGHHLSWGVVSSP
jgi:hypothetical protein